ncbi:MAG: fasciclin domain-containing protein [Pseudomonadota bacterium]
MIRTLSAVGAALVLAFAPSAGFAGHHEKGDKMEAADIVDTAVKAGQFTTLVAAVQAAGLEETLRGDGPFTVFAPTDDAFKALPEGTVETLLKPENKDQLVGILTYHVLAGKVMSGDIAGKALDADTVNGAALPVDATEGVKVGEATVVKADIATTNGVIHVIDTVLLPPQE